MTSSCLLDAVQNSLLVKKGESNACRNSIAAIAQPNKPKNYPGTLVDGDVDFLVQMEQNWAQEIFRLLSTLFKVFHR